MLQRIRTLGNNIRRKFLFDQNLRRLWSQAESGRSPDDAVLSFLIEGWGNPQWSALSEYLAAGLEFVQQTRGPILECGSGLSTLILGGLAHRQGRDYWVLEHDLFWAARVRRFLRWYRLHRVILQESALKDYGAFSWYDPPLSQMPDQFSLVICDGPPGSTPGGRYGLFPVMGNHLAKSVILLDDAQREDERKILKRWQGEIPGLVVQFRGEKKPFAVVSRGTPVR